MRSRRCAASARAAGRGKCPVCPRARRPAARRARFPSLSSVLVPFPWPPPSAPARRVERRVVFPILGGQVPEQLSRGADVVGREQVDSLPVLARENDRDGKQPFASLVVHG